jgi:hypothetical protein
MAKYTATVDEDRRQRMHALPGRVHLPGLHAKGDHCLCQELEKNPDLWPGSKPRSWGTGLRTLIISAGRNS